MGFYGVPRFQGDPRAAQKGQLTPAAKQTRVGFAAGAVVFALVGGGIAAVAASAPELAALTMVARITAIQAGLFGAAALLLGNIAQDPPSPDFEAMWEARELKIGQILPDKLAGNEGARILFPVVEASLYALSALEAVSESLDRASGAEEASNQEKSLAHLRASQGYALGFARALAKVQQERLIAAGKLRTVSIGDGDRAIAVGQIRITYSRAVAIQKQWRRDGLDRSIVDALSEVDLGSEVSSSTVQMFLSTSVNRRQLNKSVSDIFEAADLVKTENRLITAFEKWGNFYR